MHANEFFAKRPKLAKERAKEVGHTVDVPDFHKVGKDGMGLVSLERLEKKLAYYERQGKKGTALSGDIAFWKKALLVPGKGKAAGKCSGREVTVHLRFAHECKSSRDGFRAGSVVNKKTLPEDLQKAFAECEKVSAKILHQEKSLLLWVSQWNYAVTKLQEQGLEINTFVVH